MTMKQKKCIYNKGKERPGKRPAVGRRKWTALSLWLLSAVVAWGVLPAGELPVADSLVFSPPFRFPMLLSANFGELRPDHFHNGIDIKTEGVVGKPIYSIADGYVSRVLVQHGGYGQAVCITHPGGLTSLYGHIVAFAPQVQDFVRAYQYANETFTCDLTLEPDRFPVKRGDLIALSGNEGASAGPHLHLELRRTGTGDFVNPFPYFRHLLKDTRPPEAQWVGFYPVRGRGVVDGAPSRRIVPVSELQRTHTAWGDIYTAISAKDFMDGTSNHYGVHTVRLTVDGREVFRSTTDEVAPAENRRINGFIDYEEYACRRRLLMRSAQLPGNRLRLVGVGEDRGVVTIDQERDYAFCYELTDESGNVRTYRFTVRGEAQPVPAYVPKGRVLRWNRTNVVQEPGLELEVPRGQLYDDAELRTAVRGDTAGISFEYVLDLGHTPLHGYCPLSIGIRHFPVADKSKYYIVQKSGKGSGSVGGQVDGGWIKARVRSLGTFSVAVDTVPPVVEPVGQPSWRHRGDIRFKVRDTQTGIQSYKVYVDGQFVLSARKGGTLRVVDMDRIRKGVPHELEVVVTDGCGNETRRRFTF